MLEGLRSAGLFGRASRLTEKGLSLESNIVLGKALTLLSRLSLAQPGSWVITKLLCLELRAVNHYRVKEWTALREDAREWIEFWRSAKAANSVTPDAGFAAVEAWMLSILGQASSPTLAPEPPPKTRGRDESE